ncbi:hypothetical protein PGT21_026119 [Puccinia graminis f. sp. tritici]|uniref:PCI domain-containing protein n=1 Tax=Puccinia graminis f. sp. tritici TaxID=56615 RepID=A0A5B0NSK1_PUCGR|nr:hypothetical protein PGT21_026119 [Puccinia graminis f. sp. tritici]
MKRFDPTSNSGETRWQELHKRVVEHVSLLSELLDLTIPESEATLAKLVSSKTVFAKIDRPSGIVRFK